MKKKLTVAVLCLALAMSVFAFTACGDKDGGKTNFLTVSQDTYTDAKKAVEGYIANELENEDDDVQTAVYVSHESKSTVKADNTDLTDAQKQDLASVEKVAAKITVTNITGYNEQTSDDITSTEDITQTVYLLKYGETSYRYAVAAAVTGERATKSYLASITKAELYENSEITMESSEKEGDEEGYYKSLATFTKDAMYIKTFTDKARAASGNLGYDSTNDKDRGDSEAYYFLQDSEVTAAMKSYREAEPKWVKRSMDRYQNMAELLADNLDGIFYELEYVPSFKLKVTKGGLQASIYNDVEVTLTIKVKDGKVTEWNESASGEDDGVAFEYSQKVTAGKFGKASVTVPDEAKNAQAMGE